MENIENNNLDEKTIRKVAYVVLSFCSQEYWQRAIHKEKYIDKQITKTSLSHPITTFITDEEISVIVDKLFLHGVLTKITPINGDETQYTIRMNE